MATVLGAGASAVPSWAVSSGASTGGLHGQVTGPDGTPLRGIRVTASPEWSNPTWAVTDAAGRYTFTGLAPQTYSLGFEDLGDTWVYERYDDAFGYEPSTQVTVVAGSDAGPYDAALGLPGSISGTVTGDGAAVDGSSVYLYQRDGARWRTARTTSSGSASGRYTFEDLSPGTYRIGVDRPDEPYVDTFYPSADLVENGQDLVVEHGQVVADADISLLREGAIVGTVTDELGAPVAGVEVTATDTDMETRYFEVVTDDDGRYRIGGLTTDDYEVRFNAHAVDMQSEYYADAPTQSTSTPVRVVSGRDSAGIDAQLSDKSYLRGTVTDAETGDPIPFVRLELYEKQGASWQPLWMMRTYTDRRGRYEFEGVWGTYRLLAVDSGYSTHGYAFHPAAASVEAGETVVVAAGGEVVADVGIPRLRQTSTLTGTVTAGGVGRAGVDVEAELLHEGRWISMSIATTRADGSYRAFAAVPGTYRLRFSDPTGRLPDRWWDDAVSAADATPLVIATGGSELTDVDIDVGTLPTTGRIAGTVTGPTGAHAPDIDVTIYEWDGVARTWTDVARTRTDASGSYAVADLPVGDYRVGFDDDSGLLAAEFHMDSATVQGGTDVHVTDGAVATVDAALAPGPGDIGGVMSRTGTSSVEDLRVVAYARHDGTWRAVAQAQPQPGGQYEIKDLPPGTYRLGFHDGSGSHVDQYWSDQPTLAAAQDVVVRPGVTDWGFNAHLRPAPVVTPPPTTAPVPTAPATADPLPTAPPTPTPGSDTTPAADVGSRLSQVANDLTVTGKPKVGRTVRVAHLVAHLRTSVRYRFQWYLRGTVLKRATRSSLDVTRAMRGKTLRVKVTLSAEGAREVARIVVGRVREPSGHRRPSWSAPVRHGFTPG